MYRRFVFAAPYTDSSCNNTNENTRRIVLLSWCYGYGARYNITAYFFKSRQRGTNVKHTKNNVTMREYLKLGGILSSYSAITRIHFNHGGPFVYSIRIALYAIIMRSQFRISRAFFK